MADVVNLNQFRKAKARADQTKKAQDNRVKFGRTKAEKTAAKRDLDNEDRTLDGKEIPDQSDD